MTEEELIQLRQENSLLREQTGLQQETINLQQQLLPWARACEVRASLVGVQIGGHFARSSDPSFIPDYLSSYKTSRQR